MDIPVHIVIDRLLKRIASLEYDNAVLQAQISLIPAGRDGRREGSNGSGSTEDVDGLKVGMEGTD